MKIPSDIFFSDSPSSVSPKDLWLSFLFLPFFASPLSWKRNVEKTDDYRPDTRSSIQRYVDTRSFNSVSNERASSVVLKRFKSNESNSAYISKFYDILSTVRIYRWISSRISRGLRGIHCFTRRLCSVGWHQRDNN